MDSQELIDALTGALAVLGYPEGSTVPEGVNVADYVAGLVAELDCLAGAAAHYGEILTLVERNLRGTDEED